MSLFTFQARQFTRGYVLWQTNKQVKHVCYKFNVNISDFEENNDTFILRLKYIKPPFISSRTTQVSDWSATVALIKSFGVSIQRECMEQLMHVVRMPENSTSTAGRYESSFRSHQVVLHGFFPRIAHSLLPVFGTTCHSQVGSSVWPANLFLCGP